MRMSVRESSWHNRTHELLSISGRPKRHAYHIRTLVAAMVQSGYRLLCASSLVGTVAGSSFSENHLIPKNIFSHACNLLFELCITLNLVCHLRHEMWTWWGEGANEERRRCLLKHDGRHSGCELCHTDSSPWLPAIFGKSWAATLCRGASLSGPFGSDNNSVTDGQEQPNNISLYTGM